MICEHELLSTLIKSLTGLVVEKERIDFTLKKLVSIGWGPEKTRLSYFREVLGNTQHDDYITLIDLLTVHETYFFREYDQLEVFANELLNPYAKKKSDKSIRILSAGCSTGEEVYTLAIILSSCLDNFSDYHIEIVGTDISDKCVSRASKGLFGKRSVKYVPLEYLQKFFTFDDGYYQVQKNQIPKVSFIQGSLLDHNFIKSLGVFDFVFCRNVLIYFEDKERLQILTSFKRSMYPEGRLFLGHSESILKYPFLFDLGNEGLPIYKRKA